MILDLRNNGRVRWARVAIRKFDRSVADFPVPIILTYVEAARSQTAEALQPPHKPFNLTVMTVAQHPGLVRPVPLARLNVVM